jgi:hypothetical protein
MGKSRAMETLNNYLDTFNVTNSMANSATSLSFQTTTMAPFKKGLPKVATEKTLAGLKLAQMALWLPTCTSEQETASNKALEKCPTFQLLPASEVAIIKSKPSSSPLLEGNTATNDDEPAIETKEAAFSGFRSLFDAYSRKQLPEVLLINCKPESFPAYWLALARYALLL